MQRLHELALRHRSLSLALLLRFLLLRLLFALEELLVDFVDVVGRGGVGGGLHVELGFGVVPEVRVRVVDIRERLEQGNVRLGVRLVGRCIWHFPRF